MSGEGKKLVCLCVCCREGGGGHMTERSEPSVAEKHKLRGANWLVSTTAELGHFRTTQQIWVQLLWRQRQERPCHRLVESKRRLLHLRRGSHLQTSVAMMTHQAVQQQSALGCCEWEWECAESSPLRRRQQSQKE